MTTPIGKSVVLALEAESSESHSVFADGWQGQGAGRSRRVLFPVGLSGLCSVFRGVLLFWWGCHCRSFDSH